LTQMQAFTRFFDNTVLDLLFALVGMGDGGLSGSLCWPSAFDALFCRVLLPNMHRFDGVDHYALPHRPVASYFCTVLLRALLKNPNDQRRAETRRTMHQCRMVTLLLERFHTDKERDPIARAEAMRFIEHRLLPASLRTHLIDLIAALFQQPDPQTSDLQLLADFLIKISGSAVPRSVEQQAEQEKVKEMQQTVPASASGAQQIDSESESEDVINEHEFESGAEEDVQEQEQEEDAEAEPDEEAMSREMVLHRVQQLAWYRSEVRNEILRLLLSCIMKLSVSSSPRLFTPETGPVSASTTPARKQSVATPPTAPRAPVHTPPPSVNVRGRRSSSAAAQPMDAWLRTITPSWLLLMLHNIKELADSIHAVSEQASQQEPILADQYLHSILLLLQLLVLLCTRYPSLVTEFRRVRGFEGLRLLFMPIAPLSETQDGTGTDSGDHNEQDRSDNGVSMRTSSTRPPSLFLALETLVPSFFSALLCHHRLVANLLVYLLLGMEPPDLNACDHETLMQLSDDEFDASYQEEDEASDQDGDDGEGEGEEERPDEQQTSATSPHEDEKFDTIQPQQEAFDEKTFMREDVCMIFHRSRTSTDIGLIRPTLRS